MSLGESRRWVGASCKLLAVLSFVQGCPGEMSVRRLARCYVMNGKAKLAWELYLTTKNRPDGMLLLNQLANDCYRMGAFFYAAKAFSTMERYDMQQEYWEGKRGACIGVLQQVIAGEEPKDSLPEVLEMLRAGAESHPQQEHVAAVIAKWCRENDVHFGM